jgi:chemotaxis protein MotB
MDGGASFFKFRQQQITQQNQDEVAKKMQAELERLLAASKYQGLLKSVEIKATDRGIMVELHEEKGKPLFKSGSTTFTEEAKTLIDAIAAIVQASNNKMVVSGFTDAARYGTGNYDNWNLSADRAQTLRRQMMARGVDRARLARVDGYGDTQLKAPETPYSSLNRRLTILLLNEGGVQNLIPREMNEEDKAIAEEEQQAAKQKYYGRLQGVQGEAAEEPV